jgi:hypothetical protein
VDLIIVITLKKKKKKKTKIHKPKLAILETDSPSLSSYGISQDYDTPNPR